jgi:hypothetical protein
MAEPFEAETKVWSETVKNYKEELEHSPELAHLAVALVQAQKEMGTAKKDATNPHFRSKYADLVSVVEALREPLADNGLAIIQMPVSTDDGRVGITTMLLHASGEWLKGTLTIRPEKETNPQTIGSILTYFRRYGMMAVTRMASDEDDDDGEAGRVASESTYKPKPMSQPASSPAKPSPDSEGGTQPPRDTSSMVRLIHVLMRKQNVNMDDPKEVTEYAEVKLMKPKGYVTSLEALSWDDCRALIAALQKK